MIREPDQTAASVRMLSQVRQFFVHAECPEDIGGHPADSGGKGNGRKLPFGFAFDNFWIFIIQKKHLTRGAFFNRATRIRTWK